MSKKDFNKSGAADNDALDPEAIFKWLFYQFKLLLGMTKPGEEAEVPAPAGLASLIAIFTGNANTDTPSKPVTQITAAPEAPKLPAGCKFVMYGDSHAQGLCDHLQAQKINVHDMATDGAGLLTNIPVADAANIPAKSAVFVSIGTNDVGSLVNASEEKFNDYVGEMRTRIQTMREKGCVVYLASINPPKDGKYIGGDPAVWNSPEFQEKYKQTAEKLNRAYAGIVAEMKTPNVQYFDMTPFNDLRTADKLHYDPSVFTSIGKTLSAGPAAG